MEKDSTLDHILEEVGYESEQPLRVHADVKKCARCGEDHSMTFKLLKCPIEDTDGTVWQYWGPCPVNGEPVLMKRVKAD